MESAIWTIFYDYPQEGRKEYLDWLHEVQIPKMLARSCYLWAAHYQVVPTSERGHFSATRVGRSNAPALPTDSGYAFLIGGESTRIFFDPTPSRQEEEYDAESRQMFSRRSGPVSYVHTVEWRIEGPAFGKRDPKGVPGPVMQMGCFDASGRDEELGAWYAQERMVRVSKTSGAIQGRKLLAAAGIQRHGVLYDFMSLQERNRHFLPLEETEWTSRIHPYLIHPQGSAFVGRRIWPL
jgi:hypothetical protein